MGLFNTRRRKILGTIATCAVAGIATLAFAAWLSEGTGEGQGKTGALQPITVTKVAGAADCFPGQTCELAFSVNNPNAFPLTVTAAERVNVQINTGATGCPGGNWFNLPTLPNDTKTGLSLPLTASGSSVVKIDGLVALNANAPTDCQGKTFTTGPSSIKLTATN
jgi:hypothetical protein